MKQTLLFLFLALSFFTLKAQPYLNSTARWTQTYSWSGFNAHTNCTSVYYVAGDSVVNDTSYLKINLQTVCYYSHTEYDSLWEPYVLVDTNASNGFSLLLREANKQFIRRSGETENLLYNFNLSDFTPIETATPFPSCGATGNVSLMTHDTVCIGSIGRKRWRVSMSSYPLANYFIEGVGPSSGFNAPICRYGCPECSYTLSSFELNGDTLYHGSCSITGIENATEQSDFTFQYGMNSLTFQAKQLQWVELYSAAGLRTHIIKANAGKVELSTNALVSGVYIYRAWVAGKMQTGK
ncbi:MAG: hypothetical protein RLZZ543_2086, partial [Bacteroidota bacterium]